MYGKEKLLKVNEAIAVLVKSSKHMVAEILGVPCEEAVSIDVHESIWCQPSIRTILFEPSVPCCDGVHTVVGVRS